VARTASTTRPHRRIRDAKAAFRASTVLIMDEPFSALDYSITRKMELELLDIWQEKKITTLFVSHDIDEAIFLADRVVVLSPRPAKIKKLGFQTETLVVVAPGEYKLFKKQTVIDCNRAFEKTVQSFIDKLKNGKLRVYEEMMPDEIVSKLIQGVLASSHVTEKVQDMLRETAE
jgi:ABC-type nitrate/sulfonate/bicarbonate transport system ATPase subunit